MHKWNALDSLKTNADFFIGAIQKDTMYHSIQSAWICINSSSENFSHSFEKNIFILFKVLSKNREA